MSLVHPQALFLFLVLHFLLLCFAKDFANDIVPMF